MDDYLPNVRSNGDAKCPKCKSSCRQTTLDKYKGVCWRCIKAGAGGKTGKPAPTITKGRDYKTISNLKKIITALEEESREDEKLILDQQTIILEQQKTIMELRLNPNPGDLYLSSLKLLEEACSV